MQQWDHKMMPHLQFPSLYPNECDNDYTKNIIEERHNSDKNQITEMSRRYLQREKDFSKVNYKFGSLSSQFYLVLDTI